MNKLNSVGIGLLETLLAIGLFSLVLSGAVSIISTFLNYSNLQKMQIEKTEFVKVIESALSINCECVFKKSPIKYSGKDELTLKNIGFYSNSNCDVDSSSLVLEVGKGLDGSGISRLKLGSISVINIGPQLPGPNKYFGDIKVDFVADKASIAPFRTYRRPFTFEVDPASQNLIACSYDEKGNSKASDHSPGVMYGYCSEANLVPVGTKVVNVIDPAIVVPISSGGLSKYSGCGCPKEYLKVLLNTHPAIKISDSPGSGILDSLTQTNYACVKK